MICVGSRTAALPVGFEQLGDEHRLLIESEGRQPLPGYLHARMTSHQPSMTLAGPGMTSNQPRCEYCSNSQIHSRYRRKVSLKETSMTLRMSTEKHIEALYSRLGLAPTESIVTHVTSAGSTGSRVVYSWLKPCSYYSVHRSVRCLVHHCFGSLPVFDRS